MHPEPVAIWLLDLELKLDLDPMLAKPRNIALCGFLGSSLQELVIGRDACDSQRPKLTEVAVFERLDPIQQHRSLPGAAVPLQQRAKARDPTRHSEPRSPTAEPRRPESAAQTECTHAQRPRWALQAQPGPQSINPYGRPSLYTTLPGLTSLWQMSIPGADSRPSRQTALRGE